MKELKIMQFNKPISIIDIKSFENDKGTCVSGIEQVVINDTLILKLSGIIEQKEKEYCISIEKLCIILRSLDLAIKRVILTFDTPGGSVEGIQELTKLIKSIRARGIVFLALSDSCCCSSGYWIASACDQVYLSSSTARMGSVGVVAVHEDTSKKDELEGVKYTELVAGKYKRIDSEHKLLSPEGRAIIQSQVDYIYSLFVSEISENRNILIERVIAEIGDARIFIGKQAIEVGLADGICSLNEILEGNYMPEKEKTKPVQAVDAPVDAPNELEMLKKENEDLKLRISELEKKLAGDEETSKEALSKEKQCAAQTERKRILALEEMAPVSCTATLLKAKTEGWSIDQAAIEFLKESKKNVLRAESTVVPTCSSNSDNDSAKRMADSINKKRIRS
jgi:signal peptide peptidase SppA